ncbi:MAG: four helix bundle protein [Bacteroidetes bacterium]|nr:four helix bundle protein [Bacteroidota bacterium]
MDLVVALYEVTRYFPRNEEFGLVSQIRRAAVSVPSNIAEGMTRRWPKERTHFLNISQGSLSELDTQLDLARRLGYTPPDTCNELTERMSEIQRLLGGLIRSLRS